MQEIQIQDKGGRENWLTNCRVYKQCVDTFIRGRGRGPPANRATLAHWASVASGSVPYPFTIQRSCAKMHKFEKGINAQVYPND
jgi:hypothetical protein